MRRSRLLFPGSFAAPNGTRRSPSTDVQTPISRARAPLHYHLFPLLLALGLFFALEFLFPRFPDVDEVFFKAPGRNLSAGGPFAAPELRGFLGLQPPIEVIYFPHPPLYPWLFGQLAKLVGFGWQSCVGYDALISAALAICVYGLANHLLRSAAPLALRTRAILALIPTLFTLLFRQPARPDELGMLLGYANAWLLLGSPASRRSWVAMLSGSLAGLQLCTSFGVFLCFLPFHAALWLRSALMGERRLLKSGLALAAGSTLAVLVCLGPLYLAEPHFYRQFLRHAGAVAEQGAVERISEAWQQAWQVARFRVFLLAATLPLVSLGLWLNVRPSQRQTGASQYWQPALVLYVAPFVGFLLVWYLRSAFTYWWFLQPWFLMLAIVCLIQLWQYHRHLAAAAGTAWLLAWCGAAALWPVTNLLTRICLPAEQTAARSEARLRSQVPAGATVLTFAGWWSLARDRVVYDPTFSEVPATEPVEYFVANGNGSRVPGVWVQPENDRYREDVRTNFEVVADNLPREPLRLFGKLRLTHSAYGFGTIVLRRRTLPADASNSVEGRSSR